MKAGLTSSCADAPWPAESDGESARLSCLRQLQILDTPPDAALDDVTQTIAVYFGVPTSLVSLVDAERLWFKSKVGLSVCETPRSVSFCHHAIQETDVFVVQDALQDSRFHKNQLVTGEPHIRFYAGAPLRSESGLPIGTLCLIDRLPRSFNSDERQRLAHFASVATAVIEDLYENSKIAERLSKRQALRELRRD